MKKLLLPVILLLGYSAFAQNTDRLLNEYYSIKGALVNSDARAASAAIAALQQTVKADNAFTQKEALSGAVDKLAKAKAIEKQRAAFNDVSTILWKIIQSSDEVSETVYYQYCPMKKAYWLSEAPAIKNPYYGSAMLTCGKVAETRNNVGQE
jgi:HPt (histidine-containing phosphotransfer) domain-containing protein